MPASPQLLPSKATAAAAADAAAAAAAARLALLDPVAHRLVCMLLRLQTLTLLALKVAWLAPPVATNVKGEGLLKLLPMPLPQPTANAGTTAAADTPPAGTALRAAVRQALLPGECRLPVLPAWLLRRSLLLLWCLAAVLANCDLRQTLTAYSRWSYTLKHSMTRPKVPEPRCLMVM